MLRNPDSGKDIYLNHPNWMGSFKGNMVLVDGLQRITAAFINYRLPPMGTCIMERCLCCLPPNYKYYKPLKKHILKEKLK